MKQNLIWYNKFIYNKFTCKFTGKKLPQAKFTDDVHSNYKSTNVILPTIHLTTVHLPLIDFTYEEFTNQVCSDEICTEDEFTNDKFTYGACVVYYHWVLISKEGHVNIKILSFVVTLVWSRRAIGESSRTRKSHWESELATRTDFNQNS